VARGDVLANKRPDLAEQVRLGSLKPAAAHRQMKRDEVADQVTALPEGKYTVLYADPPWSYSDKQAVKGDFGTGTGAAECHYPAMTLPQLKALPVADLAAADSVLFLWATSPLLPDALELARAWGFTYKASFVWDKMKHNMGHYNSVRHEFLLLCTRGSCTPQNVKLFDSVQSIERGGHSEKPEAFRQIIETLYPAGRKVELFARKQTKGWVAWGNETKSTLSTAA
jgi:N6-adenosine-specific RNA methylase IME4